MSMWTPPTVSRELLDERQKREAEALRALRVEHQQKWVDDFNRDLERCWSGMRLVWCPDPAPVEAVAMGAQPGRWGILMPSQTGGPGSVKALTGDDGESYVEPGSWVFDMLRATDWWNPEVRRDRERVQRQLAEAKEKRKQQERRERDEEMADKWKKLTTASISMNTSRPWTQNLNGRRYAKKNKG